MQYTLKDVVRAFTFSVLAALAGCAKYSPKSLPDAEGTIQEKNGIEVSTKTLTDLDSKKYFNRKLIAKGYQPIHLSVKNKSNKTLILSGKNISLPLEQVKKVSKKAHYNPLASVIGWSIGGLFIWPLFIPAIAEGITSMQANAEMDEDFVQRAIDPEDQITIVPHQIVNKVVFVSLKNYSTHFSLDLISKDDGKRISFNV